MREIDPNACIDFIIKNAGAFAQAKGELAQLETFKSSLKAIMMKKSGEQTIGAQEREAYSCQEYQDLCKAIGQATENAEKLKWELEAAKLRHATWQTLEVSNRTQDRILK
jgi:thiamine pyrophosphokinase